MDNLKEIDLSILKRQIWLTGKAPLASFEDLPTDEQNSSNCSSCNNSPTTITEDNFGKCTTTEKREITVVVTDHDNINDKNNFKVNESNQFKAELIGSEQFLSLPVPKEAPRKGSWTDFFFSKKSPTKSKRKFSLFPFKFTFKDDKKQTDSSKTDSASIEDRSSSSLSPDCFQLKHLNVDEQSSLTSADTVVYINNDGKNNSSDKKSVKNEIIEIGQALTDEDFQIENPIELSDTEKPIIKKEQILVTSENKIIDNNKNDAPIDNVLIMDKNVMIEGNIPIVNDHYHKCNEPCSEEMLECRGECSECDSVVLSCDCMNNESDMDMAADNEDNDCHEECQSKYDSYELIMLVKNDELDLNQKMNQSNSTIDDTTTTKQKMQKEKPSTLKVNFDSCNKNIKISPIERPHSIIPVNNMNNFEAYLQSLSNTINQTKNEDKLKIVLPGDEFAQENGDRMLKNRPRKSNPFIWQEFCEKGLKSPQILRKRANSCFPGISENIQLDVEQNKDNKYENNDDNGSICSPNENLTPITPIKNLNMAEEDMFGDKNFCTMALLGKQIPLQFKCNNEFSFECNCSCTSSITSSTTTSNNNGDNKNNHTIYSENVFSTEVTSDENEPQTHNHNKLLPQQDLNTKDICKTEFSEDHPLVSPCTCICHRVTSGSSTIGIVGKELLKKNREFTSDEITDLCLLSSSSTLSSSPSLTTSCSSSSSTASSPAS